MSEAQAVDVPTVQPEVLARHLACQRSMQVAVARKLDEHRGQGLEEMFTVARLGASPTLHRSAHDHQRRRVAHLDHPHHHGAVKNWRDGEMRRRWCADGMLEANDPSDAIKGHRELPGFTTQKSRPHSPRKSVYISTVKPKLSYPRVRSNRRLKHRNFNRQRDILPQSRAAGFVRAKTGTLTGVSAEAGFVVTCDGELVQFAFLADRVPFDTYAARDALDEAAAALTLCR